MLIGVEDEEDQEEEGKKEETREEVGELVNISLNSVIGITNSKNMKLFGTIGEEEVIVMIGHGLQTILFQLMWCRIGNTL